MSCQPLVLWRIPLEQHRAAETGAFSQPFLLLIRLLPASRCLPHWRLYLSFVFHHAVVVGRFILTLPVASLQFSVPSRRLRRWMTRVIVLMKERVCPFLSFAIAHTHTSSVHSRSSRGEKSTTASLPLKPSQNMGQLNLVFSPSGGNVRKKWQDVSFFQQKVVFFSAETFSSTFNLQGGDWTDISVSSVHL